MGNLLQNAVKFTPPGGSVSVEVRRENGSAVISVRDTGVGISPEIMSRMFEPFTQANRSLDRTSGGLGLGLAVVRGLAELHGGEVTAYSAGPGQGATFTLRLPIEREVQPEVHEAQAGRPGRHRVLVIEDDADSAESLKEVLEMDQHDVAVASTGSEGLAKARGFAPEVVLCDIGLPDMDGYEVARALRSDADLREVTLVALTGYASADDQKRSVRAGFDHHLAKPLDMAVLASILAGLPGHHAPA